MTLRLACSVYNISVAAVLFALQRIVTPRVLIAGNGRRVTCIRSEIRITGHRMYYSVCYKLSTFRTETLRPACNSSIDDVIVVVVAVITYMCVLHCCAENDAIIIVRKIVFAATSSGQ